MAGKAATGNNARIVAIRNRVVDAELSEDIVEAFLNATFNPLGLFCEKRCGHRRASREIQRVMAR